jgi:hypothetical protein
MRAEIEAAIRGLPIVPEEEWQVPFLVRELCLRAANFSASKGDGRGPPHSRPATRQMTLKELEKLERQCFDIAQKIERGIKTKLAREQTKRAREKLVGLIEGLHAPTIEALDRTPGLRVGGGPIHPGANYFENRLPKKLLEEPGLSALELRSCGELARAAIKTEKGRDIAEKAESGDPLLAMFPDLRRLLPKGPQYAEHVGRLPNRQLQAIANLITKAYFDLTGREPTFSQGTPGLDEDGVHGPFIKFARKMFAIMGIDHDPLRYVSVAAFALRGRGRKQ